MITGVRREGSTENHQTVETVTDDVRMHETTAHHDCDRAEEAAGAGPGRLGAAGGVASGWARWLRARVLLRAAREGELLGQD